MNDVLELEAGPSTLTSPKASRALEVITPGLGTNRSGPTTDELISMSHRHRQVYPNAHLPLDLLAHMSKGKPWCGKAEGFQKRPSLATREFGRLVTRHQALGDKF